MIFVISDFVISCDFMILKVISVISVGAYEISEVSDPSTTGAS